MHRQLAVLLILGLLVTIRQLVTIVEWYLVFRKTSYSTKFQAGPYAIRTMFLKACWLYHQPTLVTSTLFQARFSLQSMRLLSLPIYSSASVYNRVD